MDELFDRAAERLAAHPYLGRIGELAGTHELIPHESYRLAYEISGETVWILTLNHTARQWPPEDEWAEVERLIQEGISPEQAANRLELEGGLQISHEIIYQHIYPDKRKGGETWHDQEPYQH